MRHCRVLSVSRALLYGTLAVGILDALDAIVVFGLRSGATPLRIFQGIAAGLYGRASYDGGWRTAAIGVCLHFTIACGITAVYLLASRRWPTLARRPWMFGPLYGVGVYAVMTLVVIPLSAIGPVRPSAFALTNGLIIHMLGVGLPAALVAARTR